MLLNIVWGFKSYKENRTIGGVRRKAFRPICYALGLLDDDKEWMRARKEASNWAIVG